jgi:hypothetical protein
LQSCYNSFAEQSGWVGKDDGLLVFDKNNNGKIDDYFIRIAVGGIKRSNTCLTQTKEFALV